MPRRTFWLVTGAAIGAGSSLWVERRVRRTLRSAHSDDPGPMAAPVTNQKVRLGTGQDRPFPGGDEPFRSRVSAPEARRLMPVAAPARTARTFTTGLAKAR